MSNAVVTETEDVFQLIACLANVLDRAVLIETVETLLAAKAVVTGDSVVIDDISIRFGADNRVRSVCRTVDGTIGLDADERTHS